jgi:hypothetical protein
VVVITMTLAEFRRSLAKRTPPADLSPALAGLWWAAKDKWETAHKIVMDEGGRDCARVHAHLHRVEGDPENAGYWYRRAGVPAASGGFKAEWTKIARDLLARAGAKAAKP